MKCSATELCMALFATLEYTHLPSTNDVSLRVCNTQIRYELLVSRASSLLDK